MSPRPEIQPPRADAIRRHPVGQRDLGVGVRLEDEAVQPVEQGAVLGRDPLHVRLDRRIIHAPCATPTRLRPPSRPARLVLSRPP